MKRLFLLCSLLAGQWIQAAAGYSIYDTLQVTHTNLRLDILNFKKGTLRGKAEVSIQSKQEELKFVPLQLLRMQVDTVWVNGVQVKGYQYNDTLLRVPLHPVLKKGEEACVSVAYHGKPVGSDFGGFVFTDSLNMAHNMGASIRDIPHSFGRAWFPCVDDFRSRSTFDLYLRTEKDKKAVGSGILQETVSHTDGTATWHWRVNQPIPDYLLAVAVSNYDTIHYDYRQASGKVVPIDIYVLPQEMEAARETYSVVPKTLEVMEKYFGDYAFDRVGYVSVNSPGGAMEHVTNISMPINPRPTVPYQTIVIHELIHAWFGNRVTCATAEDMWLNEGLTTFCPELVLPEVFSDEEAADYVRKSHWVALLMAPAYDGGFLTLAQIPQSSTYGPTTYHKGAMVIHTLRNYLGDDRLLPALKDYVETYSFRHATTQDFETFISQHTGENLTDFFDLYVNNPGFVAFEIDSITGTSEGGGYKGRVWLEQKRQGAPAYGRNVRVPVTFFDRSGKQCQKVSLTVSGEHSSHPVDLPFEPAYGLVDPDYEICKASLTESFQIDSAATYASRLTAMEVVCKDYSTPASVHLELYNVAPDAMKQPSDLQLSDSHYWRVTGNLPAANQLSASFQMDRRYLAAPLLASGCKDIYIMYRANPAADWSPLQKFTVEEDPRQKLTIEKLMPGEYCLAIQK